MFRSCVTLNHLSQKTNFKVIRIKKMLLTPVQILLMCFITETTLRNIFVYESINFFFKSATPFYTDFVFGFFWNNTLKFVFLIQQIIKSFTREIFVFLKKQNGNLSFKTGIEIRTSDRWKLVAIEKKLARKIFIIGKKSNGKEDKMEEK